MRARQTRTLLIGTLAWALTFVSASAQAGTITASGAIFDMDGAGANVIDGIGPSIVLDMQYGDLAGIPGASSVKQFQFFVAASGATVLHTFTQTVANNSQFNPPALPITSYVLLLGFTAGFEFIPSAPGDGLSFVSGLYPGFSSVSVGSDEITFSGGSHPFATTVGGIAFTVNVPDGIASFSVRQEAFPQQAVPEPVTLLLLGTGLAAAGVRRRMKKHG